MLYFYMAIHFSYIAQWEGGEVYLVRTQEDTRVVVHIVDAL